MLKIQFFIFFFINLNLHSQEKKIYYFDDKLNEISRTHFLRNFKSKKYLMQTFELDTAYIDVSVRIKNYGKLDKDQFKKLINSINYITKQEIDDSKFLIIHYYPGFDVCNNSEYPQLWNTNDKNYVKQLNKITPVNTFFIYQNDEKLEDTYSNKFDWFKDKNQAVENQFFKYHYLCGSFVVIAKTGDYISHYGEYGKQTVLDITKELRKKTKND